MVHRHMTLYKGMMSNPFKQRWSVIKMFTVLLTADNMNTQQTHKNPRNHQLLNAQPEILGCIYRRSNSYMDFLRVVRTKVFALHCQLTLPTIHTATKSYLPKATMESCLSWVFPIQSRAWRNTTNIQQKVYDPNDYEDCNVILLWSESIYNLSSDF